ncbi:TPA: lipid IV(A) 3-deoxy-D-manno-octulosonic acid transferase [Vibrio parahaemolyticus]|uniref:lipid IV(A) 3-deoxy-D-manno-octulosonic acid transferase n=1 Tax=Vibrio parahaemolyticus TaxID=670 RepID=UPI0004269D72|nr:lipid IV(A) 3-deoxy-D-manno-octulosonic acid transferase [Vibrio parahaemolyticus]EIA1621106.1 lipid IV(A) 3-deoxy-D-manno-octulosonic acid transferase [Vibrio parahaemolyticus]EIV8632561.1 lipid IV(A) 3-deoxy-D-manno-octulosonic acid transferase [Vibrio parahaemolyticus]EIZ1446288.1 lipid IV(A) 3-deoxy-D-manno-octulosonic acid transferase [Vibrio parahaemolyticus]EJF4456804.1 lipid IV(A) 3-deoxy-D-manno-octulosonic acid transferase [Vibrio parahaemolyticus]EKL0052504.1 lipid IV(A) 3-deoxy-
MLVRIVYTLLLALASPLLLFGLYKSKPNKPKFGSRWKEHFGITPKLKSNDKPIWIHAVSVGESIAATPLIKALKEQNPEQSILVTTTTSTGAEQIAKLGDLVEHRYMPIDFGFAIKGFLKAVQPKQMLIIETELWPNTLHNVHKAGIPITVVNARLSEKSCKNYAKIQRLFNQLHPCLTQVLCQTASDAERFERLGVEKKKLSVTGSIKFDIQISEQVKQQGQQLRAQLGNDRPIWIAASTHKGEDELVLDAHRQVLKSHPNALLVLVPRHPERFDDVFTLCQHQGFKTVRRTSTHAVETNTQVYLGDTMGEMLVLIGAADICFMGGSLIGDKVGGHNVLEPTALGLPIINGPSYFNFKEIVETLVSTEALVLLHDSHHLGTTILNLLNSPQQCEQMGSHSNEFMKHNQGALSLTVSLLNEHSH